MTGACPPYSPLSAANFFIKKGLECGRPVDPLKLQKLVYFAHGWHLAVVGRPLINENIEAWQYGPVSPTVYHEFKHYGRSPVMRQVPVSDECPSITDQNTLSVLEKVWSLYSNFTGIQLSNLSHTEGSPWAKAWSDAQASGKVRGKDISDLDLHLYFYNTGHRSGG
jgi:uncharacterized phage-associated protein